MRLRNSLALGIMLPFTLLGVADFGRSVVSPAEPEPQVCQPYDPGCDNHGEGRDFSDSGVGCIDDCLAPAYDYAGPEYLED